MLIVCVDIKNKLRESQITSQMFSSRHNSACVCSRVSVQMSDSCDSGRLYRGSFHLLSYHTAAGGPGDWNSG